MNSGIGGSWFARVGTAVHEGFHELVARYLPTFRRSPTLRAYGVRLLAILKKYLPMLPAMQER